MKSFAAVIAALLVTVGAANAGEIVITPKASDGVLVLTIRGGKDIGAANAGEFVINPKASDRSVVLTIRGGKIVKAMSLGSRADGASEPDRPSRRESPISASV